MNKQFCCDLLQKFLKWKFTLWILIIFIINLDYGHCEMTKKVLLVGFDGFRWDYMTYTSTPNLDRIKRLGTSAPYINNVFTSITFPSMYSIVTGLYPESHGIVGYAMYDAEWNETWTHRVTDPKWYNEGEPIWVTARKQGLDSGAYFWLGSEIKIRGYLPNYYHRYNESHTFNMRVDEVIRWFTEEDVSVVALYFHEPDNTGHIAGPAPQASQTIDMIKEADKTVGYLLDQMQLHDLDSKVNVIVTSDHGMTECSLKDKTINLYDYISVSSIRTIADEGAVANILPAEGRIQRVFEALKNAHPNMSVYYKQDVPEKFHFKNHRRIHPIVAIADEGWLIIANGTWPEPLKGMHGYDSDIMSMKPFFLAMGPDIKENYTSPVFNQVDIYTFICTLLEIEPSANNGSLSVIGKMLKNPPYHIFSIGSTLTLNLHILTASLLLCVLVNCL